MQEKLEKIELFLYVLRFMGICQFKFSEKPWQDKLAQGTYVHALARAGAHSGSKTSIKKSHLNCHNFTRYSIRSK